MTNATSSMSVDKNSMRVFALKFHSEYDDIFVTGGWDNTLKVGVEGFHRTPLFFSEVI